MTGFEGEGKGEIKLHKKEGKGKEGKFGSMPMIYNPLSCS